MANMVAVSMDVFFAAIGHLDIHPRLGQQAYDTVIGYKSYWTTSRGNVLGISFGIERLGNKQYKLEQDTLSQYQAAPRLGRAPSVQTEIEW